MRGKRQHAASAASACLLRQRGVQAVEHGIGEQRFVRFANGGRVGLVLESSPDEAARIAPASNGPGDPYAYKAVDTYVVAWRGALNDPQLRLVEECLTRR
jgi:hypothetical protein